MKRRYAVVPVYVATVLLGVLPISAFAQEEGAPTLIGVNLLQVKPDMMDQFRDLHQNVFMPANRKEGVAVRVTSTTVFGQSFQMAVSFSIASFAELDEGPGGLTENEGALASKLWAQCVDSRRAFVVRARPDLSMDAVPVTDLSRRVRILVKQGKTAEFEALWASEVLPAIAKSGTKGYRVYQTVLGGDTGEYWGIMPLSSFAALDGWSIFQGLSAEDAAKLNARATALIESLEVSVTRLDRELSYGLPGLE